MATPGADGIEPVRSNATQRPAKPHPGHSWFWTAFVVAFLALQVGLGGFSIYLATSDRSWSVVPDYHQGSLRWDETRAALRASDALKWKSEIEVAPLVDADGKRTIRCRLTDAEGEPIQVDSFEAVVFHHARANSLVRVQLRPGIRPGVYEATLPMARPGLWEVRLTARRGADQFLADIKQDVGAGNG